MVADESDCLGLNGSREGEEPLGLQNLNEVMQGCLCRATWCWSGQQAGVDAWNRSESGHTCMVLRLLGLRDLNEATQTGCCLERCC